MPELRNWSADLYTWRVTYDDTTVFNEIDETGAEHGFAEVDLTRVHTVAWLPDHSGLQPIVVQIDPATGQRPILFRRRVLSINPGSGEELDRSCVHVLGWQRTINGRNVASYTFILPDGSILLSDDYQAV